MTFIYIVLFIGFPTSPLSSTLQTSPLVDSRGTHLYGVRDVPGSLPLVDLVATLSLASAELVEAASTGHAHGRASGVLVALACREPVLAAVVHGGVPVLTGEPVLGHLAGLRPRAVVRARYGRHLRLGATDEPALLRQMAADRLPHDVHGRAPRRDVESLEVSHPGFQTHAQSHFTVTTEIHSQWGFRGPHDMFKARRTKLKLTSGSTPTPTRGETRVLTFGEINPP